MYSAEIQAKIAVWRAKQADGTLTIEEMKEAILLMREDRKAAAQSSATKARSAAKAAVPDADTLLGQLEGL